MRIAAIALAAAGLFAAGSAIAAERVSDSAFIKANRCRGLAAAEGMGQVDTQSLDAFIKEQGHSRMSPVMDMAAREKTRARREAASLDRREKLQAELNGPCMALIGHGKDVTQH